MLDQPAATPKAKRKRARRMSHGEAFEALGNEIQALRNQLARADAAVVDMAADAIKNDTYRIGQLQQAQKERNLAEERAAKLFAEANPLVRVLRVIEYYGPRQWVEDTVSKAIHGTMSCGGERRITGFTLTEFADKLELARQATASTIKIG